MALKSVAILAMLITLGLAMPRDVAAQPLATLANAEQPAAQASTQYPPGPAGLARVWFLHQFRPEEGRRSPMVFVNGAPLASSEPGSAFYRDFAPGTYTFSVETCTEDTNQAATLNLAPGSQTDLEIQSLRSFHSWSCPSDSTYYVRLIPPAWAQLYLPQLSYRGAR